MPTDILIVGGGITGLHTAMGLQQAGRDVRLLESQSRPGGRLAAAGQPAFDLGASWIWPHEDLVQSLVRELGLTTFAQFGDGALVYDLPDRVQAVKGGGSGGSQRVAGGVASLADAVAKRLAPGTVVTDTAVTRIEARGDGLVAIDAAGVEHPAEAIVVALPPALAMHRVSYEPALEPAFAELASATPVWMGSIVKTVVTYEAPFWRSAGFSGAAMSQRGPLQEIHDLSASASPAKGEAALFGFTGLVEGAAAPAKAAVLEQLARLFGPAAAAPMAFHQKDWSADPHASPPAVRRLQNYDLFGHPAYRATHMGGRLHFASCETGGPDGHVESALRASTAAVGRILSR